MNSYVALIICFGLAELLRRCCVALIKGLTGPLAKVPGPFLMKFSAWPWTLRVIRGDTINLAPELFRKYGDTVRISPGEVMCSGKSAIHKIIVEDDFLKGPRYEKLNLIRGISTLLGERDRAAHKQKRRLLSAGFSTSYLKAMEPFMQHCVQAFAETLDRRCADGQGSVIIDMYGMMSNLTSDVMSATSFGGSFDSVRTNNGYMKNLILAHLKETAMQSNFPVLKWLPFFNSGKAAEMDKITDRIVSRRLNSEEPARRDILQIILDIHKDNPESFTEKHIKEEMRLFLIAGSDTTGTAAAFAILLLVNNQDRLDTLKKEIDSAFPSRNDPITFANTLNLPYLNAVINESQRVMPFIVSGLQRVTTESTILGKYEIPPNTVVMAWISVLFKDPNIWPDPEKFVPERWLGEYKDAVADRKAFIPFSAGSRSCIGQYFALKELRLILATLIRGYELSLIPGQSHELRIQVIPYFKSGKYLVGVKARE